MPSGPGHPALPKVVAGAFRLGLVLPVRFWLAPGGITRTADPVRRGQVTTKSSRANLWCERSGDSQKPPIPRCALACVSRGLQGQDASTPEARSRTGRTTINISREDDRPLLGSARDRDPERDQTSEGTWSVRQIGEAGGHRRSEPPGSGFSLHCQSRNRSAQGFGQAVAGNLEAMISARSPSGIAGLSQLLDIRLLTVEDGLNGKWGIEWLRGTNQLICW